MDEKENEFKHLHVRVSIGLSDQIDKYQEILTTEFKETHGTTASKSDAILSLLTFALKAKLESDNVEMDKG